MPLNLPVLPEALYAFPVVVAEGDGFESWNRSAISVSGQSRTVPSKGTAAMSGNRLIVDVFAVRDRILGAHLLYGEG